MAFSKLTVKLAILGLSMLIGFVLVFVPAIGHVQADGYAERKVYSYSFSNVRADLFGRRDIEGAPGLSVISISRNANFVYLVDPIHSNIKMVDLTNGQLTCSQKLSGLGRLTDVIAIDSFVYVAGSKGMILALDKSLQIVKQLRLNVLECGRRFLTVGSTLYSFCPEFDARQDHITYEFVIKALPVSSSDGPFLLVTPKGYDAYMKYINGFGVIEESNRHCLKVDDTLRCFDSLSFLHSDYENTRSVVADRFSVTYFTIGSDLLSVVNYTWDR